MITIRKAEYTDLYSIAVVQVNTNRTTYSGIMPDEYLSNLSYEDKAERWKIRLFAHNSNEFMYVAECSENGIIGFAAASTIRTDDYYERELNAIYILKEFQGKGIGKSLIKAVVTDYLRNNIKSMLLWTLEENQARGFYEHLGGRVVDSKTIDRGGKQLVQVAYGWDDISSIFK